MGRIEVDWNDLLLPSVLLLFHWPSLVKAVLPDGSSARLLPGGPHTTHLWMCRNFVCHLISKVHFLNFFTLFVYLYEKEKRGKKKFLLDLEQAKPQNSVTNVHCWCSQHIPGLSSLRSIALGVSQSPLWRKFGCRGWFSPGTPLSGGCLETFYCFRPDWFCFSHRDVICSHCWSAWTNSR